MPETRVTYCRNCPSLCGLVMDVEDNKILEIRGDRDHPLTSGYLCVKGLSSGDWQNGEDRVLTSSRLEPDGSRTVFHADRAIDEIADRLSAIIAEHGPDAVALYYGTGCNNSSVSHSAMKGFMKAIGSPYIFSSMTVDQSAKWVTLGRMGMFLTGKYSALDADVIMEVGANAAISHTSALVPMNNPMPRLRDQQKRGLRLICVDPRRTETARKADIHLQIKPGEDAALFAGMIRILLERGWHNQDFCARFVGPLEPIRAAVEDFKLDYVAERAGVSAELIVKAVELFSRAQRKSASSGTGPDMSGDSNTAEHLIEAFNALCGGYRRAGDIMRNIHPMFGGLLAQEMVVPPDRMWERPPFLNSSGSGPLFGEYPSALLPREIASEKDNRIRALIVVGGNPAKAISDPDVTLAALQQLELLVTLDPRPTDTMAVAHYAIPASLPYERDDYTGIYDNISAFSFAQVATPIVERPPGVIDDLDFFWGVLARMGKSLELKPPSFGASHDQIPGPALTLGPADKPRAKDVIRAFSSRCRFTYEELAANPHGVLLDETAIIQPAGEQTARLELCAPDVAAEIANVFNRPASDPAWPFLLIVRRQLESMNSAFSNSAMARRRYPTNPAFMHPTDMAENSIAEGDRVRVASPYGAVFAFAQADPSLRRGLVSMSHGWGLADDSTDPEHIKGAFVGRLISLKHDLQTINYMPRQSGVHVAVERVAPSRSATSS